MASWGTQYRSMRSTLPSQSTHPKRRLLNVDTSTALGDFSSSTTIPPRPTHPLIVNDLATLMQWRRRLRGTWVRNELPEVKFQVQVYSAEQNRAFSELANGLQNSCGCATSGLLVSISATFTIIAYFGSGSRFSDINLEHVFLLAGIIILSAMFGKLLGLIFTRMRLMRLFNRIHDTIVRSNH